MKGEIVLIPITLHYLGAYFYGSLAALIHDILRSVSKTALQGTGKWRVADNAHA